MQLKITVRSAQVFKSITFFSKMHLYSVVDGPSSSPPQSTAVDIHGGATPFWWFPMEFEVDEGGDETLVACIKCRRSVMVGSDKIVGVVDLPVRALLEYYRLNSQGNMPADIALTISSKSGKPRGVLYVSYIFASGPVPSAPPLQPPVASVVPSAPYLPEEITLH